jgi:hypothetical protein
MSLQSIIKINSEVSLVIVRPSFFPSLLNKVLPAGQGPLFDVNAKKLAWKTFGLAALSLGLFLPAPTFAGDTCRQEKDSNGGTITICCDNSGTCYRKQ